MLDTEFTIRALQWTDDPSDLPIQYYFGYFLANPDLVERAATGTLLDGEVAPEMVPLSNQFSARTEMQHIKLPRGVGISNNITIAARI